MFRWLHWFRPRVLESRAIEAPPTQAEALRRTILQPMPPAGVSEAPLTDDHDPGPLSVAIAPQEEPIRRGPRIVARRELVTVRERPFPETEFEHWSVHPEHRWPPVGLVFRKPAFRQIARHVAWGQRTPFNQVEQGGLLVGNVFSDEDHLWGEVVGALPMEGEDTGAAAHLWLSPAVMRKAIADYGVRGAAGEWPEGTGIIGWYHTHPNDLPVFMSGTDLATQRTHFSKEWQYAVVLNPHTGVVRCFRGAHALECSALLMRDPAETPMPTPQADTAP